MSTFPPCSALTCPRRNAGTNRGKSVPTFRRRNAGTSPVRCARMCLRRSAGTSLGKCATKCPRWYATMCRGKNAIRSVVIILYMAGNLIVFWIRSFNMDIVVLVRCQGRSATMCPGRSVARCPRSSPPSRRSRSAATSTRTSADLYPGGLKVLMENTEILYRRV